MARALMGPTPHHRTAPCLKRLLRAHQPATLSRLFKSSSSPLSCPALDRLCQTGLPRRSNPSRLCRRPTRPTNTSPLGRRTSRTHPCRSLPRTRMRICRAIVARAASASAAATITKAPLASVGGTSPEESSATMAPSSSTVPASRSTPRPLKALVLTATLVWLTTAI